jgi:hypothetical protein
MGSQSLEPNVKNYVGIKDILCNEACPPRCALVLNKRESWSFQMQFFTGISFFPMMIAKFAVVVCSALAFCSGFGVAQPAAQLIHLEDGGRSAVHRVS